MKTNIHFWSYLAKFFLEWKMFRTKVVEKNRNIFIFNNIFSPKIVQFMRYVKKYCRAGKATDDVWRMRFAC